MPTDSKAKIFVNDEVVTDRDGKFVFPKLPAGQCLLERMSFLGRDQIFELKAGETTFIQLGDAVKEEKETTREKQTENLKTTDKKEGPKKGISPIFNRLVPLFLAQKCRSGSAFQAISFQHENSC